MSFWPTAAFVVMVLSWVAFVIVFATQKKAPSSPDKKSDPVSILGIALQGVSYAVVWIIRRPWFTPMFPSNRSLEIALSVLTMVLAGDPALRVRQFEGQLALTAYMRLAPVDLVVADFEEVHRPGYASRRPPEGQRRLDRRRQLN